MAYTLDDYASIFGTIDAIYREELNRPVDLGGLINWFYHVREHGRDGAWVRAEIQKSEEWAEVHAPRADMAGLVNAGGFFRLATGERFSVVGHSDFNLFTTYLMLGEAAAGAIIAERAAVGFNMLRVWLAYWDTNSGQGIPGIGKLNPAEFPGMYDKLAPFSALAARHGMRIEFTAFTGPHIPGHWDAIGAALQGVTNVMVELCNENDAHPVRIDPRAYQPLPGVLCSHGSNGSEAIPPRPAWGYEVAHYNDASEWWRKVGHNTMELTIGAENLAASGVPAIAGENTRPDRDGNVNHFFDAAAGAALLCAGSYCHTNSGKASLPFDERDRQFAQAWVAGARSVSLEFQDGRYVREEPGSDLRIYSRVLPDGRRHTVRIRK